MFCFVFLLPLMFYLVVFFFFFFFSSRRRHTRYIGDWSSDVCSSDLRHGRRGAGRRRRWASSRTAGSPTARDRKSVVQGKSVDLGGRRIIKKKKTKRARCKALKGEIR